MNMHVQILGVLFLYCAMLAWLSVPFVTTDKTMLRRQVMFTGSLPDHITADDIPAIQR